MGVLDGIGKKTVQCFGVGRVEIEPMNPMEYCTGVGAATSGIANPLTWVQIPACALLRFCWLGFVLTRSLDIQ